MDLAQRFGFNATVTMADPTAGIMRLNNATNALSTQMAVSQSGRGFNVGQTYDVGEQFWNAIVPGTEMLVRSANSTGWMRTKVTTKTDNGAWWTIGFSVVSNGGGGFAATEDIIVQVLSKATTFA